MAAKSSKSTKKEPATKLVGKIENSKANRNFLNWLIYHLSNGVSFEIAIEKTVKTFQNDEVRGKAFTLHRQRIVSAAESLAASCHNTVLK